MVKRDYPEWYKESHDIEAGKRGNRILIAYLVVIALVLLALCAVIGWIAWQLIF